MKKCMMIAAVLVSALAFAQETAAAKVSLADARSRIDTVIASPEAMRATMKQLSAEDQKTFLADVNKAIGKMPGTASEKSGLFVSLNLAAVASAQKGNAATLIAETFATVSPEALPAVGERIADDLLSRAAHPQLKISDERYLAIATNVMAKVNARCEETDNGSPRAAMAIVMLVRASGGTPADLADRLIDTLTHDDAKEMARDEWIPSALGLDGRVKSYESLLASADAGLRPDFSATLVIAGPQYGSVVLADLSGKNAEPDLFSQTMTPVLDAVENALVQQSPNAGNDKIGGAGAAGGAVNGAAIEAGEIGGGGGGSGGNDTRPNPTNPDPKDTGKSPVKPKPYSNQSMF